MRPFISPIAVDDKHVFDIFRIFFSNKLLIFFNMTAKRKTKKITKKSHKKPVKTNVIKTKPVVIAVGDIHGELEGFTHILHHERLADKSSNWKAKNTILVQLGDVIDRGQFGMEVYEMLDGFTHQSKKFKSKVIRLMGNHELEILRGNYFLTNISPDKISAFRKKLISDILGKRMVSAFAHGNFLFTHAGICDKLLKELTHRLKTKKPSAKKLADLINRIVIESVFKGDFTDPVFYISPFRGGTDDYGGVFWEDFRDLVLSKHKHSFVQIVGHTPLEKITSSPNGKVIATDTGMWKARASGRAYLKIRNGKVKVISL